jgi:hypothetical protein
VLGRDAGLHDILPLPALHRHACAIPSLLPSPSLSRNRMNRVCFLTAPPELAPVQDYTYLISLFTNILNRFKYTQSSLIFDWEVRPVVGTHTALLFCPRHPLFFSHSSAIINTLLLLCTEPSDNSSFSQVLAQATVYPPNRKCSSSFLLRLIHAWAMGKDAKSQRRYTHPCVHGHAHGTY